MDSVRDGVLLFPSLVVEVPVIMQFFLFFFVIVITQRHFLAVLVQFPLLVVSRPCDHAATCSCSPGAVYSEGAADSVHRQRVWFFFCEQIQVASETAKTTTTSTTPTTPHTTHHTPHSPHTTHHTQHTTARNNTHN